MTKKQMALIRQEDKIITAVFEENVLDTVIVDDVSTSEPKVGDIYVGRVSHVVKNINAAFVEIQKGIMCYLPLKDMNTGGKSVVQGQPMVVQIVKAAVKTKQAVAGVKLEFAGKYAVVTTMNTAKTISAKITDEVRRRQLQEIVNRFSEPDLGIILRTECQYGSPEMIEKECRCLLKEARELLESANYRTPFTRLYVAPPEYIKYLLKYPADAFERIITDDKEVYDSLCQGLPSSYKQIEKYEDTDYSLDKLLGISSKLQKAQNKHVWLKSGGSLVIEPTEALTVIDVNTEKAIDGKRNAETTFYKINREAAVEAARQIRIRNISGIIIIDFIDMKDRQNQKQLLSILEEEFAKDYVHTNVVDITKLGLVEITRKKIRKPLWESLPKS